MMALSHTEHTTSVKPSAVLTAYLSIVVILDAVRIRTLWLSMQETRISILFTTATGIKLAILILENTPKTLLPTSVDKGISPEELSGIFGLSLFTWILPIMKLGFRKTLVIDDLYTIDREMASKYLGHKTQREWDIVTDSVETPGKLRKGTLIWIISKTLSTSIFVPVLPRLCLTGFTFSQPLLVNRMLKYLQNSHEESLSNGYGLLGAYALLYIGITIATGCYQRLTNRWIIMTRGSLTTPIYNKTLTMSNAEDERLSISLMSNNVQRIIAGPRLLHETWACTLEAGLAIWLLELQIRWATVGVVVVFLTCTGLTLLVSKYIGERQRAWIQASQKRVNATANMLGMIKEIKMVLIQPEPLSNPSSSIIASHEKSSDIVSTFASENPNKDNERFTNGDLHAVGSGGINLSGGQKQRIALARAIYARRELLILDDVFSGIDKETEGLIFHRLWGSNGLLRRLQATVVLATHATHRLWYADQIFVLSAEGVPLEQGTLDGLIASNGYIASVYSGLESNGQDSQEDKGDTMTCKTEEEKNIVVAMQPLYNAKHRKSH
ncbi:hypothetical protein V8C34DRAFT_320442 [Trichoderma compactum]